MRINSFSSSYSAKSNQAFGMKFKQSPEMEYFVKESIHGHGDDNTREYMESLRGFLPDTYMLEIKMTKLNQFNVNIARKDRKCLWSIKNVNRNDNSTSEDVLQILAMQTDDISKETIIEELQDKKEAKPEPIIDAEIVEDAPPLRKPKFSEDSIVPEILADDEDLKSKVAFEDPEELIIDAEIVD